jgi:hypothetical protein
MEPCVYFYITQRRGQDASWAFLAKWLPISLQKMIGILLMHPLKTLASKHLATRFSIDTRPTPASSCPNLSPSSDRAAPLKQCDRPFPGHSLSLCDRSSRSFSPCDRQNLSPTVACDRPTASLSRDFRQSFSLCDRPFSGSDFGPCDRPNQHSPLPQCKTLSLRRESGKRSACLHPLQVSLSLARPRRTLQRYNFRLSRGLLKFAEVLTIQSQQPPGPATLAKRSCVLSSPTPVAGATA